MSFTYATCVCGYHFRNTFYNYSVNYDIGLKQVGFKTLCNYCRHAAHPNASHTHRVECTHHVDGYFAVINFLVLLPTFVFAKCISSLSFACCMGVVQIFQ